MRRWSTFLGGVLVGGLLVWGALNYHLVHARSGLHLVPKLDATFAGAYVDIRDFGPRDWAQHQTILLALLDADRTDLLGQAADDAVRTGLDRLLGADADRR
ncbi:MAG TPA: hypothetical protein PJ982_11115 [Lacipirellulaceae bacterium]|nr:hypothetical protein [Lacipirellulaceae bacterium]